MDRQTNHAAALVSKARKELSWLAASFEEAVQGDTRDGATNAARACLLNAFGTIQDLDEELREVQHRMERVIKRLGSVTKGRK